MLFTKQMETHFYRLLRKSIEPFMIVSHIFAQNPFLLQSIQLDEELFSHSCKDALDNLI
jgi:hypothetical protein